MKILTCALLLITTPFANAASNLFRCEMEVIAGHQQECKVGPIDLCVRFFEIDRMKKTVVEHSSIPGGRPSMQTVVTWTEQNIRFNQWLRGQEDKPGTYSWRLFRVTDFSRITGAVLEFEEYRDGGDRVFQPSELKSLQNKFGGGPFGVNTPVVRRGQCKATKPAF